ncbi:MAG: hypothetical protein OXJ62_09815 [Spirochaetaceae bacterium]|nr:hypothetical protein [Spirochaetaceae bacterium]
MSDKLTVRGEKLETFFLGLHEEEFVERVLCRGRYSALLCLEARASHVQVDPVAAGVDPLPGRRQL